YPIIVVCRRCLPFILPSPVALAYCAQDLARPPPLEASVLLSTLVPHCFLSLVFIACTRTSLLMRCAHSFQHLAPLQVEVCHLRYVHDGLPLFHALISALYLMLLFSSIWRCPGCRR